MGGFGGWVDASTGRLVRTALNWMPSHRRNVKAPSWEGAFACRAVLAAVNPAR
jgi:hypothetical protein